MVKIRKLIIFTILSLILFTQHFSEGLNLKVIHGKYFDLVFQEKCEEEIFSLVQEGEKIYEKLSEFFDIRMNKFRVYVLDTIDTANAYADPFSNAIIIYLNRNDSESFSNRHEFWLPFVFSHELTHLLVSNKEYFLKNLINPFASAVSMGFDSAFTPSWYQEGAAIMSESLLFDSGRLNDLKFKSYLKSDIKTREFFGLSFAGSNGSPFFQPPGMNYLYGADFMKYIYDKYGEEKYVSFIRDFGTEFSYNFRTVSERLFGEKWQQLIRDWKDSSIEKFDESNMNSEEQYDTFTDSGYFSGINCSNGKFLYYSDFSEGIFKIVKMDVEYEKSEWVIPFTKKFDFNSAGKIACIYGTGDGIEVYRNYLYIGEWKGEINKIDLGIRPVNVKWKDENKLLITSYENGGTTIGEYDLTEKTYEKILSGNSSFFINDFFPYKNHLIMSLTMNCETSLYELEYESTEISLIIGDYGNCYTPSVYEDKIYFSTDKDDVYRICEYNFNTKEISNILQVPFICSNPNVFNGELYFQNYSGNGYNLVKKREFNVSDKYVNYELSEFDPDCFKTQNVYANDFEYDQFILTPELRVIAPFVIPVENHLYGLAGIGGWDDLKKVFWYAYYSDFGTGESFDISVINREKYPFNISFNGNVKGVNLKSEFEFPFTLRENEKLCTITPKISTEINNIENIQGLEDLNVEFELKSSFGKIYNMNNDFSVPEFFSIMGFGKYPVYKGGVGFKLPLNGTGIAYLQSVSEYGYISLASDMWFPVSLFKPFGTSEGMFSFGGLTGHVGIGLKNANFPVKLSLGLSIKTTIQYWFNSVLNMDLVLDYPNVYPKFSISGVGI